MGWKELVMGNMSEDIGARRQSNISTALPTVLAELKARHAEKRGIAAKSQMVAEEATYAAYPEAAAKRAGIDIGTAGGEPGMRKTKTTRGGTVYEAPDILDEAGLSKLWMDYVAKIQSANAANEKFPNYTPIPVPNFVSFVQRNFPEYVDVIRQGGGKGGAIDPQVQAIVNSLKTQGKSSADIRTLMKASKKYKDIDPTPYGI